MCVWLSSDISQDFSRSSLYTRLSCDREEDIILIFFIFHRSNNCTWANVHLHIRAMYIFPSVLCQITRNLFFHVLLNRPGNYSIFEFNIKSEGNFSAIKKLTNYRRAFFSIRMCWRWTQRRALKVLALLCSHAYSSFPLSLLTLLSFDTLKPLLITLYLLVFKLHTLEHLESSKAPIKISYFHKYTLQINLRN